MQTKNHVNLTFITKIYLLQYDEKEILIQSKKSVLFSNGDYWTKKSESDFDNAMGAYDGAECCDLVGLFMLSEIRKLNLNLNCILYRDDGLGVSSSTPRQREGIKKKTRLISIVSKPIKL